ncbi:MAG: DUF4364 family protein [Oscillospiraceae bacterium]|nr:DUF4364 family protein [Oscillospiraceae bacterium]
MARYGFIRGKLDIKLLVLYIMERIAAPIDFVTLTDLALCDEGVDYFEFAESVAELVASEHLCLEENYYTITEKGRQDGAACESSLSYSVKRRCNGNLSKVNSMLRRNAQVRAEVLPRTDGTLTTRLTLDDENGNLMTIELLCVNEEQSRRLSEGFKAKPERVYNEVLNALLDSGDIETLEHTDEL